MKTSKLFAVGLALAAMGSAATAQTAQAAQCLSEAEISGLVVYAMPSVISAGQTTCAKQLPANGFMATGGAKMAQRYAARGDASWPMAKAAFFKIGKLKPKDTAMFAQLPDEAVRPLFDALVEQMVAQEIKPGSCRNIERLVQVLDMLSPEQAGTLSGVIAALALGDDKDVKICPARNS
ncbi:hypothetical protein [Tsuneonella sp. HG222]